jgi:hypothetical protein
MESSVSIGPHFIFIYIFYYTILYTNKPLIGCGSNEWVS